MVVTRVWSAPTSVPDRAQKPSLSPLRSSGGQTVSQTAPRTWIRTSFIVAPLGRRFLWSGASVVWQPMAVNTLLIFLGIAFRLARMDGALGTMSLGGV